MAGIMVFFMCNVQQKTLGWNEALSHMSSSSTPVRRFVTFFPVCLNLKVGNRPVSMSTY